MKLDPFYPIVPSAEWISCLATAGIRLVQLRVKDKSLADTQREIVEAFAICKVHNITLVINDYWQAAIDVGAKFVHLGQEDLDTADINAIRANGVKLGISTHNEAELARALAFAPDYIALGPIWPTTLKIMPFAPQGLTRIGEWKRKIGDIPLIAIGGITLARASDCYQAGADVVSVVSDVTAARDPIVRAKAWLNIKRR